jgi:N6-adenosine-specific RNA methylase IME4
MSEYGVIYADPPWRFSTYSSAGLGRSAEAWYDCMSIDEICAMPTENLAAQDCVLLMWTTDPFLRESFKVIDSWGFTYKTVGFYWIKEPTSWFGTGYWTRANPELCLLATRGHPKRLNADVPKLIIAPRREHSRKPDETYDRIERLCMGPYIELFARQRRSGWDVLGNEKDLGPRTARKWKSSRGPTTSGPAEVIDI